MEAFVQEEARDLKRLIDYQAGAVVSKEILKREGSATVTLFAFDAGQGLSEHTAPFDALVLLVEGGAEITIDGKTHSLKEGQMIVMPAGKPHGVKAAERFKMLLTLLRAG